MSVQSHAGGPRYINACRLRDGGAAATPHPRRRVNLAGFRIADLPVR
jgi:hypothetical protein